MLPCFCALPSACSGGGGEVIGNGEWGGRTILSARKRQDKRNAKKGMGFFKWKTNPCVLRCFEIEGQLVSGRLRSSMHGLPSACHLVWCMCTSMHAWLAASKHTTARPLVGPVLFRLLPLPIRPTKTEMSCPLVPILIHHSQTPSS